MNISVLLRVGLARKVERLDFRIQIWEATNSSNLKKSKFANHLGILKQIINALNTLLY